MAWNTWQTQVSQRNYRAYKRGGTWLPHDVWKACKAKDAQERRGRDVANGWQRSSRASGSRSGNGQPPPRSNPMARGNPKTQEGKTEGVAIAELRARLEAQTKYIAQLMESVQAKGVKDLPVPPQPPRETAEEAHELDRKWTLRASAVHNDIKKWEKVVAEDR